MRETIIILEMSETDTINNNIIVNKNFHSLNQQHFYTVSPIIMINKH